MKSLWFGPSAGTIDTSLWDGVGRLLDRAASAEDLRSHRLELLALSYWRSTGRPLLSDFAVETRLAIMSSLACPFLLKRIRKSCDGPILILKGPETAACY